MQPKSLKKRFAIVQLEERIAPCPSAPPVCWPYGFDDHSHGCGGDQHAHSGNPCQHDGHTSCGGSTPPPVTPPPVTPPPVTPPPPSMPPTG